MTSLYFAILTFFPELRFYILQFLLFSQNDEFIFCNSYFFPRITILYFAILTFFPEWRVYILQFLLFSQNDEFIFCNSYFFPRMTSLYFAILTFFPEWRVYILQFLLFSQNDEFIFCNSYFFPRMTILYFAILTFFPEWRVYILQFLLFSQNYDFIFCNSYFFPQNDDFISCVSEFIFCNSDLFPRMTILYFAILTFSPELRVNILRFWVHILSFWLFSKVYIPQLLLFYIELQKQFLELQEKSHSCDCERKPQIPFLYSLCCGGNNLPYMTEVCRFLLPTLFCPYNKYQTFTKHTKKHIQIRETPPWGCCSVAGVRKIQLLSPNAS